MEFDTPTSEEIKNKAYPVIDLTPKKRWVNNTNPEFKQVYDSTKFNIPNLKEIYDVNIRGRKSIGSLLRLHHMVDGKSIWDS